MNMYNTSFMSFLQYELSPKVHEAYRKKAIFLRLQREEQLPRKIKEVVQIDNHSAVPDYDQFFDWPSPNATKWVDCQEDERMNKGGSPKMEVMDEDECAKFLYTIFIFLNILWD